MSPTERTKKYLKEKGFVHGVVEKWIDYHKPRWAKGPPGIRQDFLNIIDLIYCDHSRGVVGAQICAGSGFSVHLKKLTVDEQENTAAWLKTPGAFLEIWSWRKLLEKRGGKRRVWVPRIVEITLDMVKEG